MSKSNAPIKNLNRFFDRLSVPVYILSPESVVTYVNPAAAQWIGLTAEAIIGEKAIYTSEILEDQTQNKIRGICPSPENLTTTVFAENNGAKIWRDATVNRIVNEDGNLHCLLVVCDLESSNNLDLPSGEINPVQIHAALAKLRKHSSRLHSLENVVGTSSHTKKVLRQVETAIQSNSDIVICGPRGSGKEHLARTIHLNRFPLEKNDPESQPALIPIHCSIVDQPLIQQNIKEIVEEQRSSQRKNQRGWLLLLDVDQLGESAQAELLGFFQLPDFSLKAIATSSVSLDSAAKKGQFSQELAHHLGVLQIQLIPLTERKSDIPLLAQSLLEQNNPDREFQKSGFSEDVTDLLTEFNWPENIDQLARVIQEAANTSTGTQIETTDLPDKFMHAIKAQRIGKACEVEIELDVYMASIEKELIERAFLQSRGNKTKAAKLLGISRGKLLRRIQQLELESKSESAPVLDESAFEELDISEQEEQ